MACQLRSTPAGQSYLRHHRPLLNLVLLGLALVHPSPIAWTRI